MILTPALALPNSLTVSGMTFHVCLKTIDVYDGVWQALVLRSPEKGEYAPISWTDDNVLVWGSDNKSRWTHVREDLRRKGVGTALRRLGVAVNPKLRYGSSRSAAGEAFARAEGGPGANDPYTRLNW